MNRKEFSSKAGKKANTAKKDKELRKLQQELTQVKKYVNLSQSAAW